MTRALAFLLVIAIACPASALDCAQQPDPVAGQPISADQLECIRVAIVNLRLARDLEHIEAVKQATLAATCEATGAITCPKAEVPIVPYLAGVGTGVVLAVVVAALLAIR